MDQDTLKILGSGGLVGALLALIWVVGNRLVGAIDRIAKKVEDHTGADLAHHAEVKVAVARLEAKVEEALDRRWDDLTPVEQRVPRRESPARGAPTAYSHVNRRGRGGTEGEG